ncbi:MAG: signal peptidase I [Propioniciclava sp.]
MSEHAERETAASEPSDPTAAAPERAVRRPLPLWASTVVNLALALALVAVVQHFVVRVHNVYSGSMEQTLAVTDRILSSELPYLREGPQRGDVIIFSHGDTWEDETRSPAADPIRAAARVFGDVTGIGTSNRLYTVKRVIGLPGEVVACCDAEGRVTVGGEPLEEPYVYEDLPFVAGQADCAADASSRRCFRPLTVPDASYLVMGDHRGNSADSVYLCRGPDASPEDCARFVPRERITGKVVAKAWPPGRLP